MRRETSRYPLTRIVAPCWSCGEKVEVGSINPDYRAFCAPCEKEYLAKKGADLKEYVRLKALIMHERAMRMLEKQHASLYMYKEASEVVLEFALQPGEKFSSSHEMVAAMELIRNQIKIKTQQTVGDYRVDFIIPSMEVVFEVDGYMHRTTKIKDSQRDIELRQTLGATWEIVRIGTNDIEKHVNKLIIAIEAVADYKREIRSKNNGILPEWYSEREHNHYHKVIDKRFKESLV